MTNELDNPRPACAVCSVEYTRRMGVPSRCIVDRALIMREPTGRGYLAIVHCHDASELVVFGDELPTNAAIAARVAFRSPPHGK